MDLTGIHHVTAITADACANYRFFTSIMGMRLVKRRSGGGTGGTMRGEFGRYRSLVAVRDGPGFAVDEDAATLGEKVALPPFLEPHREQILAGLKPID